MMPDFWIGVIVGVSVGLLAGIAFCIDWTGNDMPPGKIIPLRPVPRDSNLRPFPAAPRDAALFDQDAP